MANVDVPGKFKSAVVTGDIIVVPPFNLELDQENNNGLEQLRNDLYLTPSSSEDEKFKDTGKGFKAVGDDRDTVNSGGHIDKEDNDSSDDSSSSSSSSSSSYDDDSDED